MNVVKAVKAYKEENIQLEICTDVNGKLHASAALARREYTATAIKQSTGLNPDAVQTFRKRGKMPFPFQRIVPRLLGCPVGNTVTIGTTS